MPQTRNLRSTKMRNLQNYGRIGNSFNTLMLPFECAENNCGSSPLNSGLKFKRPIIEINKFLNNNGISYEPLNLSSVINFKRDVYTKSDGRIYFYNGELIGIREDIFNLDIKLNSNQLIISNTVDELNSFPFKFKITIRQDASYQDDGTIYSENFADVILEFRVMFSIGKFKDIQESCNNSDIKTGLFFTKDRTETCITPLEKNETIIINKFLPLENPDFYIYKDVGYYNPVDLYKAIINSRYLFANSKGIVIITFGEFISGSFVTGGYGKLPSTFTNDDFKNSIKLDDDKKKLIIAKPLNNYVQFDFKFKITIKQELTNETTDVILEYTRNGNDGPLPRCSVNINYDNCINYYY
jgi:hypothetical protein